MTRLAVLLAAMLTLFAPPASADEIEDALAAALEAYRAGDVALAREEADFAASLLAQKKAAGLAEFLPAPLQGWTREDGETQAMGAAMMGGGMVASATYRNAAGDDVEITLMADNPMVAAMAGMFANAAAMTSMGRLERIGRQKAVITEEGEIQSVVDGRVLVSVSGSAPLEVKKAFFSAIDFRALRDF